MAQQLQGGGGGMLTPAKLVQPAGLVAARLQAQRLTNYGIRKLVFSDPALFERWKVLQAGLESQRTLLHTPEPA